MSLEYEVERLRDRHLAAKRLRAENVALAAEVERLKAEVAAWERLAAWGRGELSPDGYDRRRVSYLGDGDPGVMLEQEDDRDGSYLYVEVMAGVGQYPDDEPQTVWIGTPERQATLSECVEAALDLWAELYGEGKDGGQ